MSEQRFLKNDVVPTLFRRLQKQMFNIIIRKNEMVRLVDFWKFIWYNKIGGGVPAPPAAT